MCLLALIVSGFLVRPMLATDQTFQPNIPILPEIDTYVKLNENMRLLFIASQTCENRTNEDAEIGPNMDFYLKPLFKLDKIACLQLDKSKSPTAHVSRRISLHALDEESYRKQIRVGSNSARSIRPRDIGYRPQPRRPSPDSGEILLAIPKPYYD